jgi:hypothetical protein
MLGVALAGLLIAVYSAREEERPSEARPEPRVDHVAPVPQPLEPPRRPVSKAVGIFGDVGALRDAAAPVLPSAGWRNLGDGTGFYGSSQVELPTVGFVPSTVRYSITGSTNDRVDKALISAFIASPVDLPAGRAKLKAAAVRWFRWTRTPLPADLIGAIDTGRPFVSRSGLAVRYVVERCGGNAIRQPDGSLYRCTTMELTITP